MTAAKTNEREGTRAVLSDHRSSATKVREVLKLIRGKDVATALTALQFSDRGAAAVVRKLLASAIANAANNDGMDPNELFVSICYCDESRTAGRFIPRAKGRAGRRLKRSCHITIIVSRLPEEKLLQLHVKRNAAVADRSRRVAGGRKAVSARAQEAGKDVDAAADEIVEDAEAITAEAAADEATDATAVSDALEADSSDEATEVEAVKADATQATPTNEDK